MNQQQSIEQAAQEACIEVEAEYKHVPNDGEFHTLNIANDPKGKNDARLKIFSDRQGGIVWNHKTGERKLFFINTKAGVSISDEERVKIKAEQQKRKAELIAKQNKAASKAHSLFSSADLAPPDHPYLVKKQIKPYLARQAGWEKWVLDDADKWNKIIIKDALLIPIFNAEGIIRNVQAIFPEIPPELERNKDFLPKAELSGLFGWIGEKTGTVCICEGFATGATIHEETGWRVYLAFTANNLLSVAQITRKRLPGAKIILCADNDTKSKGNPGLTKATEAARAVDGLVAVPPISGDFNDYAIYLGKQNDI